MCDSDSDINDILQKYTCTIHDTGVCGINVRPTQATFRIPPPVPPLTLPMDARKYGATALFAPCPGSAASSPRPRGPHREAHTGVCES